CRYQRRPGCRRVRRGISPVADRSSVFLRLQITLVALGVMYIVRRAGGDRLLLLRREFTHHLARRAHYQRTVGNLLALWDQCIGTDDAITADPGAVEHYRVDPDQTVVADGAAVEHGLVTDRDVLAQGQRGAGVGVHDGAVLDVAVLADQDQLIVAPQHRVEP